MGKYSLKKRRFKIREKRKKREKIKRLKERFLKTKNPEEKKKIVSKIIKIAPHYPLEGNF